MEAIYIPQLLKTPDRKRSIPLDDFIPGLETLTPLRGELIIRHGGNFLEVSVQAEMIVTLICDRCLGQYNHRIKLKTSELIWLDKDIEQDKTFTQEREIAWEDLSETLDPDGDFDPDAWLFEQLSLTLPLRQLCGKDCQQTLTSSSSSEPSLDSRWASLEALKRQLSQQ